jgi:hypothetical protein
MRYAETIRGVRVDQLTGETGGEKTSADLFAEEVVLSLPPLYALRGQLSGNPLEQLGRPAETLTCKLQHLAVKHVAGFEARLPSGALLRIIPQKTATKIDADLLLLVPGVVLSVPAQLQRCRGIAGRTGDRRYVRDGQATHRWNQCPLSANIRHGAASTQGATRLLRP